MFREKIEALILIFVVAGFAPIAAQQPPADPLAAMTAEKWREDLRFMGAEIERVHKDAFHKISKAEFTAAVRKLDECLPGLESDQAVVELMRIVAMIGDGHTGLQWQPLTASGVLPVRFYYFDDGIFVQRAAPEYSSIVGGKITKIGDRPIGEAIATLSPLAWVDNEMGTKSSVPNYLSVPRLLHAVGLSRSKTSVTLTVLKDGRELTAEVEATGTLEQLINNPREWADARNSGRALPLWQNNSRENFWFEHLGASKTLYVQYNEVQNKQNESIEAFFARVYDFAEKNPVEKLVLDLRNNGGGNNYLNLPVIIGAIRSKLNVRGRLFVIIGRETFSAAQNAVNDLEKYTNAIFVGEPTGASPNHFGDARRIELPNSKIALWASTLWWQDMDPRDSRKWKAPDLAADLTIDAYSDGRDPAMEAILNYKPSQSLEELISELRAKQDILAFASKLRAFKADPMTRYVNVEPRLNDIGYFLLGSNRVDNAIAIFRLNVELHPRSANTYDSLGEAYLKKGNKALALENYEKALKIEPGFPSAVEAVRTMKGLKDQ